MNKVQRKTRFTGIGCQVKLYVAKNKIVCVKIEGSMLCKWSLIEIGEIVEFNPFDNTYVTLYLKDT